MDSFNYKNGKLFAENVDVEKIADSVGTPVYIYSKATILDHFNKIKKAYSAIDTTICYSIKACGNVNILKILADAGSGFDIVSGGELFRGGQRPAPAGFLVVGGGVKPGGLVGVFGIAHAVERVRALLREV